MSDEAGFLSDRDIEFLKNQGAYYTGENARQQRYETREIIAARAREAFRDFALLYETLDEHERNRVFDIGEGVTDTKAVSGLQDALVGTFAFLYRSLEGEPDSESIYTRSFRIPFEAILQQGVSKAERGRQPRETFRSMVSVEFDVEVTNPGLVDTSTAIDKIADFRTNELTERELRALIFYFDPATGGTGEQGYAKLAEYVRDRREELGWDTDPLAEEQKEQIADELSPNDETDDE